MCLSVDAAGKGEEKDEEKKGKRRKEIKMQRKGLSVCLCLDVV